MAPETQGGPGFPKNPRRGATSAGYGISSGAAASGAGQWLPAPSATAASSAGNDPELSEHAQRILLAPLFDDSTVRYLDNRQAAPPYSVAGRFQSE